MSHYIVQTARAKMPAQCWGQYLRVAVLEVEDGYTHVSSISEHAKGVIRIVETWEKCHEGKTERSAAGRALKEAEALAKRLNEARPRELLLRDVAQANGFDPRDREAALAVLNAVSTVSEGTEDEP